MSAQCFLHRLLHLKQEVAERVVYGAIEFGKGNGGLRRSRCFQSLNGGKYAFQSVDFYDLPLHVKRARDLESQFGATGRRRPVSADQPPQLKQVPQKGATLTQALRRCKQLVEPEVYLF